MHAPSALRLKFMFVNDKQSMKLMTRQISNESIVALDLEANGRHRYPERICLIQLATKNNLYIIDPLAKIDISPICQHSSI